MTRRQNITIGIDGNEANIKRRVGSNEYAFELLWAMYKIIQNSKFKMQNDNVKFKIYLKNEPLDDLPKEIKWWQYQVIKPAKLWTQWRLPLELYLHRPRPDVFFSPGHYSPRWCPLPLVVSIMDLGYLKFPQQFTKPIYYQLKTWTEHSIKKAVHILTISETTKKDIINYYQIKPEKITVTYPGYDNKLKIKNEKCKIAIQKLKRKYKIRNDYIFFLGTLRPSKNVEGLLEAYSLLVSQYPNLQLVIAGKKGWLYEEIFEKVKAFGLEKNVVFTGFVPDEEVPVLIKEARVFVMPSFWEGFGIPVVRAMALGTPVVIAKAGSLPEVVGEAGVIVDPYKSDDIARGIKEVLYNKKKREELIELGLRRVKKFSWKKCGERTLEVLKKVARKKLT